jgi:tetratricopeptide (TPR) repeat protein
MTVFVGESSLGVLNSDQNRLEEARKDYEEALKIRRELATKNPEAYLPDLATTLNNLGVLNSDENLPDMAREHYEQALQTYRELAAQNPETYLPYVATDLTDLLYQVEC